MTGKAACRGAATIVNAIPTGRGAAFGIDLEADAEVSVSEDGAITLSGSDEGEGLVAGCVKAVLSRSGCPDRGAAVRVASDIPVSRGLKSSSAVSNAVVLATSRAVSAPMDDMAVIVTGVEASLEAEVTVTGAFDDAAACFMGGVVVTDNRERRVLARGRMDAGLSVLLHVPELKVRKSSVKDLDFGPARAAVDEALAHAAAGEYAKAMELNSRACSKVLGLSEEVAQLAREHGAVAAGMTGTGPATVVLAKKEDEARLRAVLERREDGAVLIARINDVPAPEVVPRLL